MGDLHEFPKKKRAKSGPNCPICGKPAEEPNAPFCSARCKTVDLGNWLGGNYRIPSEDEPDEGDIAEITKLFEREKP